MFSFINVQLFNSLLLRRECCSFSNGEYVKTGLSELENWLAQAGDKWVGNAWDELKYIRQAVQLLVIHQKSKKSLVRNYSHPLQPAPECSVCLGEYNRASAALCLGSCNS